MNTKQKQRQLLNIRGLLIIVLSIISTLAMSQEINWFSIDGGGGISSASDLQLVGVIGQSDTERMNAGNISLSGGYLPLPTDQDLIFVDGFE